MRVFVTGGAGFIGRHVVALLRERGDDIVAAVRDPSGAAGLAAAGVQLVASDLSDAAALGGQMASCDALIHGAAVYRIGIAVSDRPAMWQSNVGATERALDAAVAAGVARIVHVSTANVYGNTNGSLATEGYGRDLRSGFLSYYDETKYRAHEAAEARIRAGAPIVIALPTGAYGHGDHSQAGALLRQAFDGTLRVRALDDVGLAWIHVDDLAEGIVAVLDRGRIGESYILAGPTHRLREAIAMAAAIGGRGTPRFRLPTSLLRLVAPLVSRMPPAWTERAGLPPNLGEAITASAGVTYWASSAKAESELGFTARELDRGLRDTLLGEPA